MTSIESPRPVGLVVGLALGLLLTIVGCGNRTDGFERFPVEGSVTLDGQALKAGTITFSAQQQGASASGEVVDGAFRLAEADGLSPGPYRVELYSIRPTGRQIPSADDSKTLVEETVNIIPRRYNIQSTLKVEVPSGGPKAPLTFALTTTAPKRSGRR